MVGKVKTTVALLVFVAFFQMAPVLSAISKVTSSNSCHVDSVTLGAKRAGSVGLGPIFATLCFCLQRGWMTDTTPLFFGILAGHEQGQEPHYPISHKFLTLSTE